MNNIILTFDLEYWFESLFIQKYLTGQEKYEDNMGNAINKVLTLLNKNNLTATFFVTGKVVDKEPELINIIHQSGHEIAIHSLDHIPLWNKNPGQFDKEIKEMSLKIKDITGQKPIGHRAVNFSLDNTTIWALKILADNQLKYDSSIFPFKPPSILASLFKNSFYGIKGKIFDPHRISFNNIQTIDHNSSIIEIPLSVYHYGPLKLPIAGGIYVRIIPWFIFKALLKDKLKNETACIHFHVFDFLNKKPKIKMPRLKKIIKFYNTKNTWSKFEYIINNFKCLSAKDYLKL